MLRYGFGGVGNMVVFSGFSGGFRGFRGLLLSVWVRECGATFGFGFAVWVVGLRATVGFGFVWGWYNIRFGFWVGAGLL